MKFIVVKVIWEWNMRVYFMFILNTFIYKYRHINCIYTYCSSLKRINWNNIYDENENNPLRNFSCAHIKPYFPYLNIKSIVAPIDVVLWQQYSRHNKIICFTIINPLNLLIKTILYTNSYLSNKTERLKSDNDYQNLNNIKYGKKT